MIPNPTQRFTGRVESYRRFRPTYPPGTVDLLRRACGLSSDSLIADIAAGTGRLTEIFLAAGFAVTAVEPNAEMRAACAELGSAYPRFGVVDGTAEATGLADHSVDLITVAQAMHWFDLDKARAEFVRILKPGGRCAVLYNNRLPGGDAFHEGYEQLLQEFGIDYTAVKQQHMGERRLAAFFTPSPMECAALPNEQSFDLEGLTGRVLSSSYMPQPGQPRFETMREAIRRLFDRTQTDGRVTMKHDCVVCLGQLG
ncbi:MAG TPA: class I SAM-dependent methyltransferase [Acidobacteriaceae bacterium]|jgi:SAM-dependent methyltransferase